MIYFFIPYILLKDPRLLMLDDEMLNRMPFLIFIIAIELMLGVVASLSFLMMYAIIYATESIKICNKSMAASLIFVPGP